MNNETFTPESVDEQIEQDLSFSRPYQGRDSGTRVVQRLHALYEDDLLSTERVWERLARQANEQDIAAQPTERMSALSQPRTSLEVPYSANSSGRQKKHSSHNGQTSFGRRASLLVALLMVTILVGSLVFVLREIHPPAPATNIVSNVPGQTVYSMTRDPEGPLFEVVAWSPDSQRVALLTIDSLQIWDATTGGNRVTAHLPIADMGRTLIMAWSPDGKWIAVSGMGTEIAIVDAQTGALAHQYSVDAVAERLPATIGSSYLSTLLPASGYGSNISGLAWSPNSQQLAVTVVTGGPAASRNFDILNAQTGAVVHHVAIDTGGSSLGWLGVASWSPDGKYLAVHMNIDYQMQPMVWVWDTSDYQAVFKQKGGGNVGAFEHGDQLAWQPHTDNLAFAVGDAHDIKIELWDVAKNALLQQYPVTTPGLFAWSPDGTYLATVGAQNLYSMSTQWIIVINARSGQQVYIYKQNTGQIAALAWSPDGKYIASCDASTVRVWVAP